MPEAPDRRLTTHPNGLAALDYYDLIINQRRVADAIDKYIGPTYKQHNPAIGDGPEAAFKSLSEVVDGFPQARAEFKRVIVEGDMVVIHSHGIPAPGDRGFAVVDIFCFENGKIVEHWDVIQQVPETSVNANSMF